MGSLRDYHNAIAISKGFSYAFGKFNWGLDSVKAVFAGRYVALSQSMPDVIPFLGLIGELKDILNLEIPKPEIKCTLFEDNNGALELAKQPRYRPRTKHIALK